MKKISYTTSIDPSGCIYIDAASRTYLQSSFGDCVDVTCKNGKLIISKYDPERERKEKRAKWIKEHYDRATEDSYFSFTIRGKLTIGFCWWCSASDIQTAYPVKGDKYNRKTGIAVCYAKCCNEKIPDYI